MELELEGGLTLLTGETGAGKSILIDALGLLLGDRASSDLIRTGEDSAVVEALVELPGAEALLEARGLPADGTEIVVRREVQASGKGRATVNGALVPVATLRELAPLVATVHGQHEPLGLLDPASHLAILDRHAGLEARREALREPFARVREAEERLKALRTGRREAERRRETLEFQVREIEAAGLQPEEEAALRAEKLRQSNADRLADLSSDAYRLLYEDEESVLDRLASLYRKVHDLAGLDEAFRPYLEGRDAVRAQLQDLAFFLRDYRESIQVVPGRLDEIESRLLLIDRLKRKYGATVAEVLAYADTCRAELAALASPEEQERAWEERKAAAWAAYRELALALAAHRREAARALETRVEQELGQLAMERSRFRVRFDPEEPAADPGRAAESGLDSAEFLLAPNAGEELRPLARIASGGELSRIMLALKSVASLDGPDKTVVFDEVDAGIGGRVAEVVGRKLRTLSDRHQVLCVTHLPQIASQAKTHYAVRKRTERGRTVTEVQRLGAEERVEEVARMLGGETITEAGRRHAREMIRQSQRPAGA